MKRNAHFVRFHYFWFWEQAASAFQMILLRVNLIVQLSFVPSYFAYKIIQVISEYISNF